MPLCTWRLSSRTSEPLATRWLPQGHIFIATQLSSNTPCSSARVPRGGPKGHRGPSTADLKLYEDPEALLPGQVPFPFPPGNSTTKCSSSFCKDGN